MAVVVWRLLPVLLLVDAVMLLPKVAGGHQPPEALDALVEEEDRP